MKTLNDILDLDIIHAVAEGNTLTFGFSLGGEHEQTTEINHVSKFDLTVKFMAFIDQVLETTPDFEAFKLSVKFTHKENVDYSEVIDFSKDDINEMLDNSNNLLAKTLQHELWLVMGDGTKSFTVSGKVDGQHLMGGNLNTHTRTESFHEVLLGLFDELKTITESNELDYSNVVISIEPAPACGTRKHQVGHFPSSVIPTLEYIVNCKPVI